ncbi:ribonuclease H family protein [Candidatus Gracilibacteria bacterium]|nr:ribonuclease H family protein [Candidatus Gracilibacteria bacterium]
MPKQKYYAVWQGRTPGIFANWEECKRSVEGYVGAQYKSFASHEECKVALRRPPAEYIGTTAKPGAPTAQEKQKYGIPIMESISVDGAWNTISGWCEYQGVMTHDATTKIFSGGPYADGTNNIVEFLGLVHALRYCQENELTLPIYTDSITAISWVKAKNARTKQPRSAKNMELFVLVDRAILWLKSNEYKNPILKWETKAWGEIPADFGRK